MYTVGVVDRWWQPLRKLSSTRMEMAATVEVNNDAVDRGGGERKHHG